MNTRKFFNIILVVVMLTTLFLGSAGRTKPVAAAPVSPTDETKVPHYFGPNPNWANSPYTLPDAVVSITGNGNGATAVASVGANGAVTGITLTNPGSGYTSATVDITGAGAGATAIAAVATSGAVTSVTVNTPGAGYTSPTVSFAGGGGAGTLVQVGNSLQDRTYASDFPVGVGLQAPVLVVLPTLLPVGNLTAFLTWNQATAGSSPFTSEGNIFHAYVLRPTGIVNDYLVVYDSGVLTVPPPATAGVSEPATYPVGPVAVQAGDLIGFYGQGIPVDDLGTGLDTLSYPANSAPVQGNTITLGGVDYPVFSQTRTYSFAADVIDTSAVVPLTSATATAYGGIDAVTITNAGNGYTFPTVDFDLPDAPNGVQARAHAEFDPNTGAIIAVVVDNPGSGYSSSPNVVIRDGTLFDPINNGGSGATASATLMISSIAVSTPGDGYISAPTVSINDPSGTGATATATVNAGAITAINLTAGGSGYISGGGIKKFQDGLPMLCNPSVAGSCAAAANNLGQYMPLAVPDTTTFSIANGFAADADFYVIALVQHRERMNSSLPAQGTLLREYVQLETSANASWSQHVALQTDLPDGTSVPTLMPDGSPAIAVDDPHFLGPVIVASKDKAVRIVFYNLLPDGAEGDLFLPTDSTIMGSGPNPSSMDAPQDLGTVLDGVRNPLCSEYPKDAMNCFKDNRATLHLHGGITPWISDGTPHQWITPANMMDPYPQGVSVEAVPDMARPDLGVPDCSAATDGCMTFYYTNQQSARLMFYHDHAWGITRLNVYAGEAAGYLITDPTEQKLFGTAGTFSSLGEGIPLVVQDRTFVPQDSQLYNQYDAQGNVISYGQDPTWDKSRWGSYGDFWYHHVYMPAQNPGDPGGMSAYGRWMYGPWFWPPATPMHGPIANPYFNMDPKGPDGLRGTADDWTTPLAVPCNLDDPGTWQYDTDPFCEPELMPGTPNISVGMEQFNDTPIVNGTAYPTVTLEPKAYRFRILNAANDRFFNFQWYVGDPRTASTDVGATEVALNPTELAAAQTDPNVFPTPDTTWSPAGPSWIQIGTEGGFLPAPVVVPNQPITWITDPTRFDVGNVDKHSLLLAPAERADVIVDFSQYAGQTLILYNDAPAAFPARVASYDYYTGAPDLSPAGAPGILPGYGPNTRTVMQVKIAGTPAPAFNLTTLNNTFKHHADGSGVFESGQHPIIVGQAAYNSAYGTSFAASSWCNAPGSTSTRCDGFARISDQGGTLFGFNTLKNPTLKKTIPIQPKAIHDEMNAVAFDEFGRMTANLGVEAVPATPGLQNVTLYPYVNPQTELIDGTNLPKGDVDVTPVGIADDGTQIWKITHNGVDTHPIHWHLYDVQVLNRVTWDNIILPPDATELGWKDTLRISPLEDTIVALRPIIPTLPFELPNSVRPLNPMMPLGSNMGFNNIDPQGNPTNPVINQLVNFGWEYVFHCHILSHEEMDMMRPVSVALPPNAPSNLAWTFDGIALTLTWSDNSINETEFEIQRTTDGTTWTYVGTLPQPLHQPDPTDPANKGPRSFSDTTYSLDTTYQYRVVAKNVVGYGAEFPIMAVQSVSDPVVFVSPPSAPTNLVAGFGPGTINLTWTDTAQLETGFVVQRSDNGGPFVPLATLGANTTSYIDAFNLLPNTSYAYQVYAFNATGNSPMSNVVTLVTPVAPSAPSNLAATLQAGPQVQLTFRDNANTETNFLVERSDNGGAFVTIAVLPPRTTGSPNLTYIDATVTLGNTYTYRVVAVNGPSRSSPSNTVSVNVSLPAAPSNVVATAARQGNNERVTLTWTDNATNETGFTIQQSQDSTFATGVTTTNLPANTTSFTTGNISRVNWYFRIQSVNVLGQSAWVNATSFPIPPAP